MFEIFTCDQCGNTHQKYMKIIKTEISGKTKPKFFDTIECAVNFLVQSGWKQYKIECTVQKDVLTTITQLNERRKKEQEGENADDN